MKRPIALLFFLLFAASCFGQVGSNPFTAKDCGPHRKAFFTQ